MKSKEEILAKRIVKFPEDSVGVYPPAYTMTDESIKRNVYAAMEEYAAQFKDSPYQGSAGDQWQDEHLAEVTEIMRDVDMRFAGIGGGTRHYLRDLLFPMLQEKGLSICRAASPAEDGWVSVQDMPMEMFEASNEGRSETYNITYLYNGTPHVSCGYLLYENWHWLENNKPLSKGFAVTYYRELPSPPNKSV